MTVPQRWQRLCFSAQLSNCNLATCWHIELSIMGLVHLSIRIHLRISFSCSVRFFDGKLPLGWPWANLGRCLSNHGKTLMSTKACFRVKAFRLLYDKSFAPALGGAFAMGTNTMALIQTFSVQAHHDCSTKAVFLCTADKLQCWPMLARNGTYWCMLAFRFLHLSFIGTIASVWSPTEL